jgi:hypothetical protein
MSMVWKSRGWKRAVKQLRNSYRLMVGELFSAVSNEETRIARMELDKQLKSPAISAGRKDKEEARGNFV